MSYPKFAVGEDVLIYSSVLSDVQGVEATVVKRTFAEKAPTIADKLRSGWFYQTDPAVRPAEFGWFEPALRKRPSDLSFGELITSLKEPVGSM